MRMTIRAGCFESNSSSMHSICFMNNVPEVSDANLYDDIYIGKDGIWDLSNRWDGLNFGRYPFQILTTPGKKARYAIANLVGTKGDDAYEEIFGIIKKLHPELRDIQFKIVANATNARDYYDTGYVDDYLLKPFLEKYDISLEQFIVGRNIVVVCDGDEYCEFDEAKKSGLINISNILIEYPNRNTDAWWEELENEEDN